MRVAIVHDYLHQAGGAEKLVEKWLSMYPRADVFTSLYTPERFENWTEINKAGIEKRIHTTWAQGLISRFPKFFKHLFWLYPLAMSRVTIKDFDLVIISSTYCGKNVQIQNCKKIVHYIHSPTRFLHGLVTETDHQSLSMTYRIVIPFFKWWLRKLDLRAIKYLEDKSTITVTNSQNIHDTVKEVYGIDSRVIYPPVDTSTFKNIHRRTTYGERAFYLCHGRVSFHKRLDLAIKACLQLGRRLKISGASALPAEIDQLKQIVTDYEQGHPKAKGLVEFLGRTSQEEVEELVATCTAFLFPGKEDFGIAPIEMLAGGVPLIAYQDGGALEYVQSGVNGVFFEEQTSSSLAQAITEFESMKFNVPTIRKSSDAFSSQNFVKEFRRLTDN